MPDRLRDLLRDRIHRWIRSALAPDNEIEQLREQFYVTLRANLARVEAGSPATSPALERVRVLLALGRRPRWSECYEVEQLLVDLFDHATLRTELEIRLSEARANLRPALADYYEGEARVAATPIMLPAATVAPVLAAATPSTRTSSANGSAAGSDHGSQGADRAASSGEAGTMSRSEPAGAAEPGATDRGTDGTRAATAVAATGEATGSGASMDAMGAHSAGFDSGTTPGMAHGPAATAATVERQRALLARLVNDLQWRYTVQEGKRRFSKSLTTRTGICFLIALGFFAGLLALLYLRGWMFALSDLRLLYVAGIAGAWGASFSMLSGLKNRIEESEIYDLNTMRAATMVLARALVGAGAASVLYLFFFSGLLSGAAFPSFAEGDPCGALTCVRNKDIALLVVWCFIVGFSEKLIPGLLDKTGSKLSGEADRYRPTEPARGTAAASSTGPSSLAAGATKSGGSAAGNGVAAV